MSQFGQSKIQKYEPTCVNTKNSRWINYTYLRFNFRQQNSTLCSTSQYYSIPTRLPPKKSSSYRGVYNRTYFACCKSCSEINSISLVFLIKYRLHIPLCSLVCIWRRYFMRKTRLMEFISEHNLQHAKYVLLEKALTHKYYIDKKF